MTKRKGKIRNKQKVSATDKKFRFPTISLPSLRDPFGLIALIVAIVACVATFTVPEIRDALGLEKQIQPTEGPLPLPLFIAEGPLRVELGQMLLLATDKGIVLVRFNFYPEGAGYDWRFLASDGDQEIAGSGLLYENYARTPTSSGNQIVDLGSSLELVIGPMEIEWSYASPTSGWIYFSRGSAAAVDEMLFESLELAPYLATTSPAAP